MRQAQKSMAQFVNLAFVIIALKGVACIVRIFEGMFTFVINVKYEIAAQEQVWLQINN